MLGSAILVSSAVVHVRKKAFERKFNHIIEQDRKRRRDRKNSDLSQTQHTPRHFSFYTKRTASNTQPEVDGIVVRGRAIQSSDHENSNLETGDDRNPGNHSPAERKDRPNSYNASTLEGVSRNPEAVDRTSSETNGDSAPVDSQDILSPSRRIRFAGPTAPLSSSRHRRVFSMSGVGAHPDTTIHAKHVDSMSARDALMSWTVEKKDLLQGTEKYFESDGFIGRNSQFNSLTLAERERLGGIEYRAISLLEVVVPLYFILWQLLGCIGLGAWVAWNASETALSDGLNPWWVGAFNAVSAFNNSGMSLLDANMVAFQTSDYMLITMSLLILAGNTCYPIMLRFILWSMLKLLPDAKFSDTKSTLRFVLDHPRRCYTTLFPSRHTWWLLGILILLNGIDWAAFEILNIGNTNLTSLPTNVRVIDGLFQAFAVRSGGFYVVNISQLRIGLLVLYVIMMYISVYPVVITMRNSNVYEERSLGVYSGDLPETTQDPELSMLSGLKRRLTNRPSASSKEPRGYFVRQQLRGQLAHDLWWIVLAVLFIVITETGQFEADPVDFSVFNVTFEVISAYGCVGISVGLPNVAYSFCGGWHVLSKLILCAVMIRGRHRGLPVAIDRAVLLPGEHLGDAEEEDAQIRLDRTMSKGRSAREVV
ncbi:hypothetical protein MMC19_002700 [Ptychographa xylographoides]|nr:hypothetical protein [Ptychographa xylographoides]